MKIVFLAPFGIRPKGTVIARMLPLAAALQKVGHTVTIVAPPYTNPEDSGRVEVVNGVRLLNVTLPCCGKVFGTLPLVWRMLRATLAEKPEVIHLFKPKGYGGLSSMLHLSLQRLGLTLPPLFVDTDDWEGYGGMNELHNYSPFEKRFFAFQEQWLLRNCAGVTVASRELEKLTCGIGVPAERVLYLPNCVQEMVRGDGASIRAKFGIGINEPVVLLYTRFFEFAQDRLYRVFAKIHQRVPGVRFLVVGKGRHEEETQLLTAAQEFGFSSALVLAGWLNPDEIPDYLAAADVGLYPLDDTLVNRAKCPAKLIEIVSSGIPVVADRIGQVPEYLNDGISGYLCQPGNDDEMAELSAALLHDRIRARMYGADGRRHILTVFNWRDFADRLDLSYKNKIGVKR